jgi:hypothetical protein
LYPRVLLVTIEHAYILIYVLQRKKIRDDYFDEGGSSQQIGKKEATLIGNLRAFQFWQCMFKVHLILSVRKYPVHLLRTFLLVGFFEICSINFHVLLLTITNINAHYLFISFSGSTFPNGWLMLG